MRRSLTRGQRAKFITAAAKYRLAFVLTDADDFGAAYVEFEVEPKHEEYNFHAGNGSIQGVTASGSLVSVTSDGDAVSPLVVSLLRGEVHSLSIDWEPNLAEGGRRGRHKVSLDLKDGTVLTVPITDHFDGADFLQRLSAAVGF